MNHTQQQAAEQVTAYFRSAHWTDFLEVLKRGDEVRHAHIYLDSCLLPFELGEIIETYLKKRGIPIQRALKYLPITPDMLNIYNIMPKGMCHFEFFLRYNPDVILAPMPDKYSREGRSASHWDDEYMGKVYAQYNFNPINSAVEKDVLDYFRGDDFRYCYRMMIDEYRGLIHTHGLIETSFHPEELIPYAVRSYEEMGVKVQKALSVVFNCAGKDMPKMVFLLGAPETSVEIEWHYNPNLTIKAADPRFFRIADSQMLAAYQAARPRMALDRESVAAVIGSL